MTANFISFSNPIAVSLISFYFDPYPTPVGYGFIMSRNRRRDGAQMRLLHHYNIITNLSNCKVKFDLKI